MKILEDRFCWQGNKWGPVHWLEYCSRLLLYCFLGTLMLDSVRLERSGTLPLSLKRARELKRVLL